jgi:hypothetical protein
MNAIDKREFFLTCLKDGLYKRMAWCLRAFTITRGEGGLFEPYLLDNQWVVRVKPGDEEDAILAISGTEPTKPVFAKREVADFKKGDFIGCEADCDAPYAWVLWHHIVIVYGMGNKIAFKPDRTRIVDVENIIAERLTSNPPDRSVNDPSKIYVWEYLRYTEAVGGILSGLTQVFTPGTTRRSLVTDPKVRTTREQLLKDNKDRLHDPATISMMKSKLEAIDREWVKGDDAEDYLIGKKNFSIVRMKTLCMHGEEAAFGDGTNVTLIPTSLDEGLDLNHLEDYVNSLREGSFNRGAQTALGGEAVQYLIRVFQNHAIVEPDCGSILGLVRTIPVDMASKFIGYHIFDGGRPIHLQPDNISKYAGKQVVIRSPQFCHTPGAGYCERCMGDVNAKHPTSLGTQASDVGSTLLLIFMGKAHGTALRTTRFDPFSDLT